MNFGFWILDFGLNTQHVRRLGRANGDQAVPRQSKIANPKSKIRCRRAFSFVEVLFAVMILGIGFIMVAGVFPVAIAQQQTNGEETYCAGMARGAANYLATVPFSQFGGLIADGKVHPFGPDTPNDQLLWDTIKGNEISVDDQRYGWMALYRRNSGSNPPQTQNLAQVFILPLRARSQSAFDPTTDIKVATSPNALVPKSVTVSVSSGGGTTPDTISFGNGATGAVATGTYVIIADDPGIDPLTQAPGYANGWVFRVGVNATPANPGNTWQLMPGNDLQSSVNPSYRLNNVQAYIAGQGVDPGSGNYTGGTQDITVYSTFIQVQ